MALTTTTPIIELRIYTYGLVTLECGDTLYRFAGLGCEEEAVEEGMLRDVIAHMDDEGMTRSDDSLYDTYLALQEAG